MSKKVPRRNKKQLDKNDTLIEEVLNISKKNEEETEIKEASPAKGKRPAKKMSKDEEILDKSSSPSPKKKKSDDEIQGANLERGDPAPNLPEGWRRQAVVRKSGKTAGQVDIYFYSPDGQKLRSRPDVVSYLKKKKLEIKIEKFDFKKSGKVAEPANNRNKSAKPDPAVSKKLKLAKPSDEVPQTSDAEENNTDVEKKSVVKVLLSKKKRLRK